MRWFTDEAHAPGWARRNLLCLRKGQSEPVDSFDALVDRVRNEWAPLSDPAFRRVIESAVVLVCERFVQRVLMASPSDRFAVEAYFRLGDRDSLLFETLEHDAERLVARTTQRLLEAGPATVGEQVSYLTAFVFPRLVRAIVIDTAMTILRGEATLEAWGPPVWPVFDDDPWDTPAFLART